MAKARCDRKRGVGEANGLVSIDADTLADGFSQRIYDRRQYEFGPACQAQVEAPFIRATAQLCDGFIQCRRTVLMRVSSEPFMIQPLSQPLQAAHPYKSHGSRCQARDFLQPLHREPRGVSKNNIRTSSRHRGGSSDRASRSICSCWSSSRR